MNTNRHGGQEVYHIHMHLLVAVRWDQCWRIKVCNDEKRIFGLVSLALLLLVGCRSHPEIR